MGMIVLHRIMEEKQKTNRGHDFPEPHQDSIESTNCRAFDRQSVLHSQCAGIGFIITGLILWAFFNNIFFLLLMIPGIICLIGIPWLFRSPPINTAHPSGTVTAPSNGIIKDILVVNESEYLHSEATRFSIDKPFYEVQITRTPCTGRVKFIQHIHNSEKNNLFKPGFSPREHLYIIFQEENKNSILVKQNASHRIISRIREGDRVNCGNITGMSNFHSTIEVFIPVNSTVPFNVKVRKGQRVIAGLTELGSWDKDNGC